MRTAAAYRELMVDHRPPCPVLEPTAPPAARGKALTFLFLDFLSFLFFFLNISCYPSSLGGQFIGWFSFGSISSMCNFLGCLFFVFPLGKKALIHLLSCTDELAF
jgi:hypothetical protein